MDADLSGLYWLESLNDWQLIGGEVIRLTSDATRVEGMQAALLHPEDWLIKRVLVEFPELEFWFKAAHRPDKGDGG